MSEQAKSGFGYACSAGVTIRPSEPCPVCGATADEMCREDTAALEEEMRDCIDSACQLMKDEQP